MRRRMEALVKSVHQSTEYSADDVVTLQERTGNFSERLKGTMQETENSLLDEENVKVMEYEVDLASFDCTPSYD